MEFWIYFTIFLALGTLTVTFFLYHYGAPYAGASERRIADIFTLLGDVSGKRIIDLGSGDGRIVIAFATKGAEAYGCEVNPLLVSRSRKTIEKKKLGNAKIEQQSLWTTDVSLYDIVIVYGTPLLMPRLEKKLRRELQTGTKVCTICFPLPGRYELKKRGDIFLYEM